RLEGDVAGDRALADLDDVDRADVRSALAERRGDLTEHAGLVEDLKTDRQTVAGRRSVRHRTASPVDVKSGRYSTPGREPAEGYSRASGRRWSWRRSASTVTW